MSVLKDSTADSLRVFKTASDAADAVRFDQFNTAVNLRPTATEMDDAIGSSQHEAVTVLSTDSLGLVIDGSQVLTGSCRVAPDGGILIDANGLTCDFGEDYSQVARGSHQHVNDHVAATGAATLSATTTVVNQLVTVDVIVNPSGDVVIGSSGLEIPGETFAPFSHTHDDANAGAAGFMSAAHFTKLDAIETANTFADTDTVAWTIGSSQNEAAVRYGAGLCIGSSNGLEVDFTAAGVAEYGHTHAVVGSNQSGLMTQAQSDRLEDATFVYRYYADVVTGTGSGQSPAVPSETLLASSLWEAVKLTTEPIASPDASNFAGLWQRRMANATTTIGSSGGTLEQTTALANELRTLLQAAGLITAD